MKISKGLLLRACVAPALLAVAAAPAYAASSEPVPARGFDTGALVDVARGPGLAGVSFDPASGTATVHVASAADAPAALRGVNTDGWTVRFDTVRHTGDQLQQVADGFTAAQTGDTSGAAWAGLSGAQRAFQQRVSAQIDQWWVDPDTNTVAVGFEHPTAALEQAARAVYGDAVSVRTVPQGQRNGRFSDSAPFYGGDRITMSDGSYCTSGFAIHISGVSRSLIAGHCNLSGTVKNGTTTMGSVVGGSYTNGGWDTAIVSGSYTGTVWDGSVTSPGTYPVSGSWRPSVGVGSICTDGSYTGKNCSGVVEVANGGICHKWSSGITTCHLAQLYSQNGSRLSQFGDSGGPVYRIGVYGGSDLEAVGIIEGSTNTTGNVAWYTPVPDLLSHWGASLN